MAKTIALVLGIVFVLVGVLGFVPALTPDGNLLGIFGVDAIHNIIHILSGAAAIFAATNSYGATRMYFQVFGVIYALVAILGFITADGEKILGLIASNTADTWLHVAIAAVALYVGYGPKEDNA
ncbi:MAG: hypothetical protein CEO22_270 [Candidatus Berkelbacteria bacterium Gr01-1014_85]|uniref:DUF4383 domain-containing protein n=1 Tax=Candidatus Berkelbacteria bacterium Gr01-1014_85 TaxID=2017150 RepID=A0A554JCJ0_9BACT|nr:MAG: hypothetical protein CEO22_270 [Candidatus Berkelbacteria bacterium Gr01-1014_85]